MARSALARAGAAIALLAWAAFAFWLFSFAYSDSYFRYSLASRLPLFVVAFAAAVAIPCSAAWQWLQVRRGRATRLRAWLTHAIACVLGLAPFFAVTAVLVRLPSRWKLSADDAMGAGIDFLMLLAMAIGSGIVLAVALALTRPRGAGL
ncbi:MAG TPA: hypothetical protein VFV84_12845 [Burkholderiales bacterium]|nr:hypothetical protein [Burkholderiales bacterium]